MVGSWGLVAHTKNAPRYPNDPSDAAKDRNGDGYTNIEKYINGLDPTRKIDWSDPKNNVDPLMNGKLQASS